MAWKAEIGGVDRTANVLSAEIDYAYNERGTATLEVYGFTPDTFDVVTLYKQDGVTELFEGIVFGLSSEDIAGETVFTLDVVDYLVYAAWRFITATYIVEGEPSPDVSSYAVLTALVAAIGAGFTLDPAQANPGSYLSAFDWELVPCADALRDVATKLGQHFKATPAKVLSMKAPGLDATPETITDDNALSIDFDKSLEGYATRVHVRCGPDGTGETWESWIVVVGDDYSWVTTLKATTPDPTFVQESAGGTTVFKTVRTSEAFDIESSSESPAAVAITSSSVAAQTELLFAAVHGLEAGDTVVIAGHSGSTPSLNGTHVVAAKVSTTRILLNVNVTVGGTGGTGQHKITTITTTRAHGFTTGDQVTLAGHTSTPAINATYASINVTGDDTFTVVPSAVVTAGGGATGTATETGADYLWNRSTHTLSLDAGTPPAEGATVTLYFTGRFPFTVTAESGASPVVVHRESKPDILTVPEGQEYADGVLAKMYQRPIPVRVSTLTHGWDIGQQGLVTSTARGLTLTAVVSAFSIELVRADSGWVYHLELIGLTDVNPGVVTNGPLDFFRQLQSRGSSGATVSGSGGTLSTPVMLTSPYPLGGARVSSVPMGTPPAYTPVLNWNPYPARAAFSVQVRASLWARGVGVGVTARLYNTTDSAVAGTSATVTSTTPTEVLFTAVVAAGKTYRLEVISDTAGESAYAIGTLEAL